LPNWCENDIRVDGDEEEIQRFIDFVGNDEFGFSFQKINPMPEELLKISCPPQKEQEEESKKLAEKYGHGNWYDWALENWGCKWDIDPDTLSINTDGGGGECVEYSFWTPWSPPLGIYKTLKLRFPTLDISWFYHEPGCKIAGYLPD